MADQPKTNNAHERPHLHRTGKRHNQNAHEQAQVHNARKLEREAELLALHRACCGDTRALWVLNERNERRETESDT